VNLSTLEFFLREAGLNVRRSGLTGLTATTTMLVSLAILGGFGLFVLNLDLMARMEAERLDVRVFLREQVSPRARKSLLANLRQTPHVTHVEFISRDDALKQVQADLQGIDLKHLLKRRRNPFPESISLRIEPLSAIPELAQRWRALREVAEVRYVDEAWRRLTGWSRVFKAMMVAVGLALLLGVMVIVGNTIKLTIYARRRDLRVMQLVGATVWFIRVPFLMEGAFYGLLGAMAASVLLGIGYAYALRYMQASFGAAYMPPVIDDPTILLRFHATGLGVGVLFGLLGSLAAMRRFVRHV